MLSQYSTVVLSDIYGTKSFMKATHCGNHANGAMLTDVKCVELTVTMIETH